VVLCVLKAHQEELQKAQVLGTEEYGVSHEKSGVWGGTGEQNDATMRMSYVVVCGYGKNSTKTIHRVDHLRRKVCWTCWGNSRIERGQKLARTEVFVRGEVERKK
jgi:hypothetical protein